MADDAAGDVILDVGAPVGVPVIDGHVDVRSVTVRTMNSALVVTIKNEQMSSDRLGAWYVTFLSRGRRVFVSAQSGIWANVGTTTNAGTGFRAGPAGASGRRVDGAFDYGRGEIRVTVPVAAFGAAAPKAGTKLSSFTVEASETLAQAAEPGLPAAGVSLRDSATSSTAITYGRC